MSRTGCASAASSEADMPCHEKSGRGPDSELSLASGSCFMDATACSSSSSTRSITGVAALLAAGTARPRLGLAGAAGEDSGKLSLALAPRMSRAAAS
uniref:Uncharacterized protein n=1 Tax=Arundo donax TaxID=35708 RepID=A0A0A9AFL7_ARUDO